VTITNGVAETVTVAANAAGDNEVVANVSANVQFNLLPSLAFDDSRLFYGQGGVTEAIDRTWDNSVGSWSLGSGAPAVTGTVKWTVNKVSPSGGEELLGILSDTGTGTEMNLMRWDGTAWNVDLSSAAITSANAGKRGFDLTYESVSEDGLVVYSNDTANPVYRTRSGGNWSSEANIFAGAPGSGVVQWVELVKRAGTNEVALLYADANSDLFAVIWDGSSWDEANAATLEQNLYGLTMKAFDGAYEGLSGDLLVVWGLSGDNKFSTKSAGSSSFSAGATIGGGFSSRRGNTVDLASEASGDRIAMATRGGGASDDDFNTAMWNGSTWINIEAPADGIGLDPGSGDMAVAVGWVGTSGTAVAIYSNTGGKIDWARWSPGAGWTVQTDVAIAGMGDTESVLIQSFTGQDKLMAVLSDSNADLYAATYDGSSWTVTNAGADLESDLSSTDSVPFGFAIRKTPIPDHMLVTATDGSATAGGAEVLSLQLVDQYGNPVSSALAVTVTVSGSATLSANDIGGSNGSNSLTGTLSSSGSGSVTITNNVAETVTVFADAIGDAERVADVDASVVFGASGADHMLVTATDGSATAGGTEVLNLQLVDQFGNSVSSGLAVTVTVSGSATFSANDLGGSNGSSSLTGTLSSSGSGSVTITDNMAETVTVSANATGDTEGVADVDANVDFGASGADHMLVTATDDSATAGGTEVLSLQLVDQYGNAVSSALGMTVTVSGSATVSANNIGGSNGSNSLTGTLSSSGSGSVTITDNVAETVTVTGNATGDTEAVANVDDNVTFSAGAATQVAFSVQPSSAQAGVALAPAIKVQVQDASGNRVTSATDTITLAIGTNPTSGALGGTLTVAAIGGEATFSNLTISRVGDGYTLTSSASGLSGATSNAFNITPGAATQLAFTIQPGTALAGRTIAGPPTVAIRDVNGDTVTADNSTQVTVAIKAGTGTSGASLSGTLTKTVVNSVAIFNDLSIDLAGTGYVLTASVSGLTAGDSVAFDVNTVLMLANADSSDPVEPGGQITYTLTFSNSSTTETALGVTLTDTLPFDTAFVSASDSGTVTGGVVTWSLGDLSPGASGVRMLVVQVKSPLANGTLLENSATLVDTQGGSAVASLTTTVQSAPILSLSVSDSPDPVAAGEQITYVLSFSNSSSASVTALGVTLTNALPSNTTFVSASDAGSVDNTSTLVTWSLGDLAPGGSGTRTLVVQVDSSLADGTLLGNSATLQDIQGNSAAASQTATVQSTPILSLSVSESSDPVAAGSEITYILSFSNSSTADESAVGVTLTNTLPSNTTFVSASDEGSVDNTGTLVTWSLGDLAPGGSGTRTLVVQVNSPLANGTLLTNSATLQDTQGSSATSNENTNVQSASLLSLSVSDTPDPVEAGQQVTYKLSFSNSSSANDTAAEVTLTNTLAANTTFVSASDGGTVEGGIVTWSLGDLAPGASGTRTLVVQVNLALANGTLLTDSAKLKDSQGNTAIANQTTTVHNIAGLSLSQGFDPDPPFPGGQLTITLSFIHSSSSNETAFEVTLTDTLPTNTTFVAASDGGIVNNTGTLVTWSLGTLAPGASGTRTLVVQLASSLLIGTQLVNNAAVQDAEGHSSNSMYTTVVGVLERLTVLSPADLS
jgi:uncharacterized repeat protein (TIGR01451 family)